METRSVLALTFGILAAWTFCEYLLIRSLVGWARHVGFSVASIHGDLPDGVDGFPREVAGFRVHRLDRDCYLVRAREWGEGGSADMNLAGLAIAVVRVDGRHWTMDARLSLGFVVLFAAALGMTGWIAATETLSPLGRIGLLAWSVGVGVGLPLLRRRTRRMFTRFVESSGSHGVSLALAADGAGRDHEAPRLKRGRWADESRTTADKRR